VVEGLEVVGAFRAWHRHAACAEYEAVADRLFPERGDKGEPAKAVCRACLVQSDCLGFALDAGLVGIWGGTSQRERQRLLDSGKVTGGARPRWGVNAMEGRALERDWESGIAL